MRPPSPQRLYRLRHLQETGRVPFSKSCIYAWIEDGKFPAPLKVGTSSVWPESAIDAWAQEFVQTGGRSTAMAPGPVDAERTRS